MLFDDRKRTSVLPYRRAEPKKTFLEQSANPIEVRVRSLMNKWYIEYPEPSRAELKGRFQSKDDEHHLGSVNELFLHALFSRLNYTINLVSPGSNNESRPDFHLVSSTIPDFDLEVTVAEFSSEERSKRKRASILIDTINRMETADFTLILGAWSGPDTDPPSRKLRGELQQWMDGLDVDTISSSDTSRLDNLPKYPFSFCGWEDTRRNSGRCQKKMSSGESMRNIQLELFLRVCIGLIALVSFDVLLRTRRRNMDGARGRMSLPLVSETKIRFPRSTTCVVLSLGPRR